MEPAGLKVGAVAKRTGLTVRTLHHYDAIGLLSPSAQTASGHRLYTEADLARLQQIVSLRQLGFPLDQIGQLLRREESSLAQVITLHLTAARQMRERTEQLVRKLEAMAQLLRSNQHPSLEELLQTIEVTTMYEKYFTPEQRAEIEERARGFGGDPRRWSEAQWKRLIAEAKAELDKGTAPESPAMRAIAVRWNALLTTITGGDPAMREALTRLYRSEPGVVEQFLGPGIDRAVFPYVGKAMAALDPG